MQADPNLFLPFVYRRRGEYLESAESSTKPTYRLEGSPTPPAASAKAESLERPRTTEEAGHSVHDVYASNENEQLAERQPAQSKHAIRHGESIWDQELEADTPQAPAELGGVEMGPRIELRDASSQKKGHVQVYLGAACTLAPKASSIAEMLNALDKCNDILAFRFTARVVDYHPQNCTDFVELACASCKAK